MPRYALINALPGLRAGHIFDTDQGQDPTLATSIGGLLIQLPNSTAENAAVEAAKAYSKGYGDAIATGIMMAATQDRGTSNIAWSPAGNGNARTFDEVGALIEAAVTPPLVYLVDGFPGAGVEYDVGSIDMRFGRVVAPEGDASSRIFKIRDGAQVKNFGTALLGEGAFSGGMTCLGTTTSGPSPLAWDSSEDGSGSFAAFGVSSGVLLQNDGTVPLVVVPPAAPDSLLIFAISGNSSAGGPGAIIGLGAGANLFMVVQQANIVGTLAATWLGANGTNLVALLCDGFDFAQIAGWTSAVGATVINQPLAMDGGTGPTANRPVGAIAPLAKGVRYYDQEIVPPKPIFWDGADFTDALGVGPVLRLGAMNLLPHLKPQFLSLNGTPVDAKDAEIVQYGKVRRYVYSPRVAVVLADESEKVIVDGPVQGAPAPVVEPPVVEPPVAEPAPVVAVAEPVRVDEPVHIDESKPEEEEGGRR